MGNAAAFYSGAPDGVPIDTTIASNRSGQILLRCIDVSQLWHPESRLR